MNKKGFTLVELLAVMTILLVMSFFLVRSFHKSFEKNRAKSFLSEALIISEGARNRYQDDRLADNFVNDYFNGMYEDKSCYNYSSALKNSFISKYSNKYIGSVEVCHGMECDYNTKIWLTDGEHYLNGVISDNTLSLGNIDDSFVNNNYLTCGVDSSLVKLDYKFDFTASEQVLQIVHDGTYSLEAWGAQGGYSNIYSGGYGAYSYTEIELHAGDMLYINVGGQGSGASTSDTNIAKGGYNGGGSGNSSTTDRKGKNGSGGGATTIATVSGFISKPILEDYLYIVAGGGGAGHVEGRWTEGSRNGYNAGGYYDESGSVSQNNYNYGEALSDSGSGGGYHAFSENAYYVGRGGTGFIGNPLTKNGVMYGYNVPTNDETYTKTISTTNVSSDPIANYAKQGNGYARIKMIDD